MPRIYIGGSAPAQTTVTTPGSYTVDVVAFTADPEATFVGPGTYNLDVKASLFASYTLVATNGAVVNVTSDAELLTTTNLVIDGASTISFDEKYSALSAVTADFTGALDGVLVPAQLLVNGQSITQPARASAIEYFHVEIAPHDVLIAKGAATESYLDIGNRGHFGTAGTVSMLPVSDPKSWEDACAPLVLAGPQLAAITARLAGRAAALKQEPALASAA
jgi:hypothetical protein